MNTKGLVSIILPCFNGEKTIGRMLESIISQSYKPIELIVINDGSTDQSEEIIRSYEKELENAEVILKYVYQENKGLGGAIDTGLKLFTGEYLCWCDPDDFYMPRSIEKRVVALTAHPECGSVTSDANFYHEDDLANPFSKTSHGYKKNSNPDQFMLMLQGESIFCSGCHMVRSTAFLDANPERSIYPARRGQNWQMLLPVYYKYRRFYLDEPLYGYVIYHNSMSSGDDTKEKKYQRILEHLDIVTNTLERIEMPESKKSRSKQIFEAYSFRKLAHLGIMYHDEQLIEKWKEAIRLNPIKWKDNLFLLRELGKYYLKRSK